MIIITYKKILRYPENPVNEVGKVGKYWNFRYAIELCDGIKIDTIIQLSNDNGLAYDWAWLKESTNPLTQLREWDE